MGHPVSITTITHQILFVKIWKLLKLVFFSLQRDLWGPKDLVPVISFWRFYVHFEELFEIFKTSIDTWGVEVTPFWVLGLASRPKVEGQILGTRDFFRTNFFLVNFGQFGVSNPKKKLFLKKLVLKKIVPKKIAYPHPPLLVDLKSPKLKKGVLRPPHVSILIL